MKVPAIERIHRSNFVVVDGIRTHYLEAGEGPPIVLLHSGEFGACAELSWEYLIPHLVPHFRVIAPDWLGFGGTAKIHDFESKRERMLSHMVRFVQVLAIERAHFIGNSMGATLLLGMAAESPCRLPLKKVVAISGGGFVPYNAERQTMLAYDGTSAAMVGLLQALFIDPVWYTDEGYIERRRQLSLLPGAWECVAASRFKSPVTEPRNEFGQPDITPYESIEVPALLIAGAKDRLRLRGYAGEVVRKMPHGHLVELLECGHCANIEQPHAVARHVLEFLA